MRASVGYLAWFGHMLNETWSISLPKSKLSGATVQGAEKTLLFNVMDI